jgi:hypothetical protein
MINIEINKNYLAEKKYIIDIVFNNYLGIKYNIIISDNSNYIIYLNNNAKIIVKDYFFRNFNDNLKYLDEKYLPKSIKYANNGFIVEKNIPIIYGNDLVTVRNNEIICNIDIFSSIFFMLTRWEEYATSTRDKHNRFPAIASLSYKNKFLNRPIVNEYIEMLWNMLKCLGISQERVINNYEVISTHDIDHIIFKDNRLKTIIGDIINRRDIHSAYYRLLYRYTNPFNSFSKIIQYNMKMNISSRFYFMAGGKTNYDCQYNLNSKYIESIIKLIKETGNIIGFHPSYSTYNNEKLWKREKESIDTIIDSNILEGRQHYIRFEVPNTWQIWENNKMLIDSSMSYPKHEGFRCGTGNEFNVFNILTRKRLNLKERPLILMDTTLKKYREMNYIKALDIVNYYKSISKKYKMPITFVFHNSSFEKVNWNHWEKVYTNIIE